MSHPAESLDDVVHQRTRLGIMAVLSEAGRAQFSYLKESLLLSDGNLSRHLSILEAAGYVVIEKGYEGKRPRTWAKITKSGRKALDAEVETLKSLLVRLEPTDGTSASPDAEPDGQRLHA